MNTIYRIKVTELSALAATMGLVGASLGFLLGTSVTGNIAASRVFQLFFESAIGPLLIAVLSAYLTVGLRMRFERRKERRQEQQQWKLQTVSLLQRITLELNRLPPSESLERPGLTAVYQYNDNDSGDPLSHVDSLFIELMKHYTQAPPGISEVWKIEIARLKHAYDDPGNHPEISTDPNSTEMSMEYIIGEFQPQLERVLHKLGENTEGVTASQLPEYTAGDVEAESN